MPNHRPYKGNDQRLLDFDTKHGVSLYHRDYHYYADGAVRQGSFGSFVDIQEPPTDPVECQKKIKHYWVVFVGQAAREFNATRDRLIGACSGTGAEEAEAKLKEMKAVVDMARRKVKACDDELLRLRYGAKTVKEAKQIDVDRREADQRFRADLSIRKSSEQSLLKKIRI